jgi:hypothetical protein
VADALASHREALWPGGVGKPLRHPLAVGLVRDCLAHLGEVGLTRGMVDVGQPCRPTAPKRHPAPQQVPGSAPVGGRDRGLREPPPSEEHGALRGVNLSVLSLAAMDRLQRQGMPEDAGNPLVSTEVRQPIPGAEACDTDDESLTRGRHGLEKRGRPGLHMPVDQALSSVVQDADRHGAGLQVEAAVTWVLCVGEAQEVSSCVCVNSQSQQTTGGMLRGRPQ